MTTALFFFGTLRYKPLLAAVLGDLSHLDLIGAVLPDYLVGAAQGGAFPTIEEEKGAASTGLLAQGITAEDLKRLDFYEGAFGYARAPVVLADGAVAEAYLPPMGRFPIEGLWRLESWQKDWADLSVLAAREAMGWMGRKTPQDVGAMFHMIRSRSASSLRARHSRHGALTFQGQASIETRHQAYAQHFAMDEFTLRHSRFDGSMSEPLERAVFRPPDAALVLPYDPVRDHVLVVEQIRMGPLIRGDRQVWQLEPIAGHIDAGETPEEAARREALEEANIVLGDLECVAETYASPGGSTEFYYLFLAPTALPEKTQGLGGLASEQEDIRSHLIPFDQLLTLCDTQQITNAPLLIAAYWLARHRARLRAGA